MTAVRYLFPYEAASARSHDDEHKLQVAVLGRLARVAPDIRVIAVPNAGKRSAYSAHRAKAEGLAKGFPDIHPIWAGGSAYIELKAKANLSPEQHVWLNRLHAMGHPCAVLRSPDSVVAFLRSLGAPILEAAA